MSDRYIEEHWHTRLTTGEKCLTAAPFVLLLFFLWFLCAAGLIEIERTYRRTKFPSGIEGCSVWLGSTLEEVYRRMGEPDYTSGEHYGEMFDPHYGSVGYKDQTLLGRDASISFQLDRNLDKENARVVLIRVGFTFPEGAEAECTDTAQTLQEYLRSAYADDENFHESVSYGPPMPEASWSDLVSRYVVGAPSRSTIVVTQYPLHIWIESTPDSAQPEPTANEAWNRRHIGGIVIVSAFLLLAGVCLVRGGQKDPAK